MYYVFYTVINCLLKITLKNSFEENIEFFKIYLAFKTLQIFLEPFTFLQYLLSSMF